MKIKYLKYILPLLFVFNIQIIIAQSDDENGGCPPSAGDCHLDGSDLGCVNCDDDDDDDDDDEPENPFPDPVPEPEDPFPEPEDPCVDNPCACEDCTSPSAPQPKPCNRTCSKGYTLDQSSCTCTKSESKPCSRTCSKGYTLDQSSCTCTKSDDDCAESKPGTNIPASGVPLQPNKSYWIPGPFYFPNGANINVTADPLMGGGDSVNATPTNITYHSNYVEVQGYVFEASPEAYVLASEEIGGFKSGNCPDSYSSNGSEGGFPPGGEIGGFPPPDDLEIDFIIPTEQDTTDGGDTTGGGDPDPEPPCTKKCTPAERASKIAGKSLNGGNFATDDCECEEPEKKKYVKDTDGDGYHDASAGEQEAEKQPDGWIEKDSSQGEDCNDDPDNGGTDVHEEKMWYLDNDGDGFYKQKKESCGKPTEPKGKWTDKKLEQKDCDDNKPNKTTDCTPEAPCEKVNRLLRDNANFNKELENLKTKANSSLEVGSINPNDENPKEIDGVIVPPDTTVTVDLIGFLRNNPQLINGFIHTHPPFAEPNFSPSDVFALAYLALNDLIENGEDFIFTLTTGRGDTFSILIDDFDQLKNFATNDLGMTFGSEDLGNQALILNNNFAREQRSIEDAIVRDGEGLVTRGEAYKKASEIALLSLLRNSGLALIKQKRNGKWETLEKQGTSDLNIKSKNCK